MKITYKSKMENSGITIVLILILILYCIINIFYWLYVQKFEGPLANIEIVRKEYKKEYEEITKRKFTHQISDCEDTLREVEERIKEKFILWIDAKLRFYKTLTFISVLVIVILILLRRLKVENPSK